MVMKTSFHDSTCQIDQEDVLFLNLLLSSSLERSCYQCKYSTINHLLTLIFFATGTKLSHVRRRPYFFQL